jgi:hypothetical protein
VIFLGTRVHIARRHGPERGPHRHDRPVLVSFSFPFFVYLKLALNIQHQHPISRPKLTERVGTSHNEVGFLSHLSVTRQGLKLDAASWSSAFGCFCNAPLAQHICIRLFLVDRAKFKKLVFVLKSLPLPASCCKGLTLATC